nr:hypothetical protein CFP56_20659 [Quercus suber]
MDPLSCSSRRRPHHTLLSNPFYRRVHPPHPSDEAKHRGPLLGSARATDRTSTPPQSCTQRGRVRTATVCFSKTRRKFSEIASLDQLVTSDDRKYGDSSNAVPQGGSTRNVKHMIKQTDDHSQCVVTGDGAVGKVCLRSTLLGRCRMAHRMVADMSSDLLHHECLPRRVHSDRVSSGSNGWINRGSL